MFFRNKVINHNKAKALKLGTENLSNYKRYFIERRFTTMRDECKDLIKILKLALICLLLSLIAWLIR